MMTKTAKYSATKSKRAKIAKNFPIDQLAKIANMTECQNAKLP